MAVTDVYENRASRAYIRTSANTSIAVSDLALPGETLLGFTIAKVFWSTSGVITLARNSVVVANLLFSSQWILDEYGIVFADNFDKPLDITVPANSTVILEVNKIKS